MAPASADSMRLYSGSCHAVAHTGDHVQIGVTSTGGFRLLPVIGPGDDPDQRSVRFLDRDLIDGLRIDGCRVGFSAACVGIPDGHAGKS